MSDSSTYLGPYARCRIEMVDGKRKGCVNEACRMFKYAMSSPFCGTCGGKTGTFLIPEGRERVDAFNLLKKDAMTDFRIDADAEYRAFIPNEHRNPPRKFSHDSYDEFEQILGNDQPAEDLEWLTRSFEAEITKLREAYGHDNVEIAWGWLSYSL